MTITDEIEAALMDTVRALRRAISATDCKSAVDLAQVILTLEQVKALRRPGLPIA